MVVAPGFDFQGALPNDGFGNVNNRVDFALRMEAFLAKHLGPN